jgi:hypothetical protein
MELSGFSCGCGAWAVKLCLRADEKERQWCSIS